VYAQGNNNNFITAYSGDSTFLINSGLQIVARTDYESIDEFGEGMFKTRLNRKKNVGTDLYGLMDSTGKIIIEPRFYKMERFNDGVAKACIFIDTTGGYRQKNQRAGIIDKKGNWIIQPVYYPNWLRSSSDSLINFGIYEKGWGAMDVTGKIIIEPRYCELGAYKYGYMEYSLNYDGSGLMKKDGTVIIPDDGKHKVSYAPKLPDDTLVVIRTLKFRQNEVVPEEYTDCKIYTLNDRFLYEAPSWEDCSAQSNGSFRLRKIKKTVVKAKRNYEEYTIERVWGMMNAAGKIVAKPHYEFLGWPQPGLKQIRKNGKYGFINDEGKEIIPCIYDDSEPFANGLAAVFVGGPQTDYFYFYDDYPKIKMGYINMQGKIIWKPSR
jgi:hypothetical protein